ncbi:MAG: hypothetical protein IJV40_02555 [Oscillospiraceae bacterium]|nr:hypothetical protein [Oscillospiraceae bacterium]
MTEKELHKLSRQDLLQLLLAQSKEVSRQRTLIEELKNNVEQERELTDRLKAKLDEKDETIEHLKHRLDAKDETMNKMKAEVEEKTTAMEALRTRLDEKDALLDATRARLDRLEGYPSAQTPSRAATSDTENAVDPEERLRRLKDMLAQSEAMADTLRKGEA